MKSGERMVYALVRYFFRLIMPSICSFCKIFLKDEAVLCVDCLSILFPVVSKKIDISDNCSVTVYAITDYKDPLKKLILSKSWSDRLASRHLGYLLWDMTPLSSLDYDFIVPIPLHWSRYAWRGFNQAEEIGRVLERKKKVPLVHLLKRVKKTAYQFGLASSMRGSNVRNAFELNSVDSQYYKDKHILLIDDLMTTGATVREAAKELTKLNPRLISVGVICRVI
jgi:ComF family protein